MKDLFMPQVTCSLNGGEMEEKPGEEEAQSRRDQIERTATVKGRGEEIVTEKPHTGV